MSPVIPSSEYICECMQSYHTVVRSWDSSVCIATGYGLDGRASDFFSLHSVQSGSATHPASYPVGTGGKAAGA
jgi:hypothetical protein